MILLFLFVCFHWYNAFSPSEGALSYRTFLSSAVYGRAVCAVLCFNSGKAGDYADRTTWWRERAKEKMPVWILVWIKQVLLSRPE